MAIYAGLDVSDKTTHICVVDAEGAVVRRKQFWGHNTNYQPVTPETCPRGQSAPGERIW